MQNAAVVLSARKIVKKFGGVVALNNGQLDVREGRITGLLGANGSGKTTQLKILSGIHQPTSGEIRLGGSLVHIGSPAQASRLGIGMVHQHLSLIEEMTVWENISLGVERTTILGFSKPERDRVGAFCSDFGVHLAIDSALKELSPGHQQLVEILKALYRQPRILLLDEPTASLELAEVERLFAVLRKIASEGVSMVFTSHRMWEVMEICDSATVFRNGAFIEDIDLHEKKHDAQYIVSLISGKEFQAQNYEKKTFPKTEKPRARLSNLRLPGFSYADDQAIDMPIYRGEIIGIAGLQGQGQEELLWALSGMMPEADLQLEFESDDAPVRIRQPRDAIRRGVFLIPGDRNRAGLFNQKSITFNLSFPEIAIEPQGFFLDEKGMRRDALQIMSDLAVQAESETTLIQNLSGGNQQKVVLGKWLNRKPAILLLSDPAKGIDVKAKKQLYDVVNAMARQGVSVILYASDNSELVAICDRIYVMFEGKIIEEFDSANVCGEDLTARSLNSKDTPALAAASREADHVTA